MSKVGGSHVDLFAQAGATQSRLAPRLVSSLLRKRDFLFLGFTFILPFNIIDEECILKVHVRLPYWAPNSRPSFFRTSSSSAFFVCRGVRVCHVVCGMLTFHFDFSPLNSFVGGPFLKGVCSIFCFSRQFDVHMNDK